MERIVIEKDIREENRREAEQLKQLYAKQHVRVVGLLGSPGAGKTTLLENLLPKLRKKANITVIEGDVATNRDTLRIQNTGVQATQINTNGACHLDAKMIKNALEQVSLAQTDLLFIENVGNLICPVSFPLGEQIRIAVISTAEGEDKPLKYPAAILQNDILIITKTDIAKYVRADAKKMAQYALQIHPEMKVFFAGFDDNGSYTLVDPEGNETLEAILLS